MDIVFWSGGIKWKVLSRYIGPYKVAHWLRKFGYQTQVIDFVTIWQEKNLYKITKKFVSADTKILAISTTFISNETYCWDNGEMHRLPESVVNVARRLKDEFPNLKIIMGGYMSDKIDSYGVIDATVMSYTTASEDIILEYLDHLVKGTPRPYGQLVLPGITSSGSNHRMVYDRARNPVYNIETDDFRFTKQDGILPGEPLPLDISRGCIFACKFCQYPHLGKSKLDYIRGMAYIEHELRYNYENFGTTSYYILDDTFNDTEIKLQAFYDMTQRLPFKVTYVAYLRADLIDRFPNMAYLLKESGCFGAYHGIETLDPKSSVLVGKGWSGKRARDFIPELYHNIWKKEVPMHTNFIIGFPTDTIDNVKSTVSWYLDNDLHSIHFNWLGLYGPNNESSRYTVQSEFDKNAEKYGFEFTSNEAVDGLRPWKNKNWTDAKARNVARKANDYLAERRRNMTWLNPGLLWYGYSKEELQTKLKVEIPWDDLKLKSIKNYKKYFQLLLKM